MSLGMLGKYERISVLGRGVSGIVYLAKDTFLNRQVALKEVDVQAGDLRRFLEEARVMDRLRHPNIVRVNGIDRIDDKVVIDMEYVRGRNLQETLRAEGPLSIPRSLEIGIQILDALDYAHSMQTVHRDIKPANILLARDGIVKLADFGLAEILATNAYACGAGTYAYMAPEDFEEENHSDNQSDIWAVSVTLFEMMTGQRPFDVSNPKSPFAWKRALETQSPCSLCTALPAASQRLGAIIARGMARDKDLRYRTAGEFRSDLADVSISLPSFTPALMADVQAQDDTIYGRTMETVGVRPLDEYPQNVWTRDRTPVIEPAQVRAPHSRPSGIAAGADTAVSFPSQVRLPQPRQPARRRMLQGFIGRSRKSQLAVWPTKIDFGSLRQGESRQVKLSVRISNLDGESSGKIVSPSDWICAEPAEFESARQTILISALSDRATTLGAVEEYLSIETCAGSITVPISINILKPRPTFRQVAPWFVPLFGAALAPALVTAMFGSAQHMLAAPAAVSSLALGLMLLLIIAAADSGIRERIACGVMMACMCFVLGINMAAQQRAGYNGQSQYGTEMAGGAAIVLGLIISVQLLTLKRWKYWGFVLAFLGLLLGGVCYHVAVP